MKNNIKNQENTEINELQEIDNEINIIVDNK